MHANGTPYHIEYSCIIMSLGISDHKLGSHYSVYTVYLHMCACVLPQNY